MEQNDNEWLDKQPKEVPIDNTTVPAAQNGQPIQAGQNPTKGNDRAKCNKLVIASLCTRYLPAIVIILIGILAGAAESDILSGLAAIIALIVGPAYIASWVLAILAHSADKKAVAPIVLLVIYGVGLIVSIISVIFIVNEFFRVLQECSNAGF